MRPPAPSLFLSALLGQLVCLVVAGADSPITLRKVSDEVFGDTGGTGGYHAQGKGGGALWARGGVEAGQASAKTTTGFSTVIKPSATATSAPTASATSTQKDLFASATALPAHWYKELQTLTLTTKIALAIFTTLSLILLITTLTLCLRRRASWDGSEERDEVPPMAFDDRATTLPKSKNSYRRRSYRMFSAAD